MSDLRKFLELVDDNSNDEQIELYDSFEIELNDDFVIETGIVGFTKDGIILEGDEIACKLLGIHGALFEDVDKEEYDDEAGMFKNDLQTIQRVSKDLEDEIAENENLPEWCQAKIAQAKGMIVSVMDYIISQHENGEFDTIDEGEQGLWANIHAKRERIKHGSGERMRKPGSKGAPTAQAFKDAAKTSKNEDVEIAEAEYQGRKVPLNKPMQGDVKKSKVYVRKPNGKVVKVNFGDKNMRIKKSNPDRRKSFRARHHCENPGPKWKARYWSCRAW